MINLGTLNDITVSNDDFLPISIIKQVKNLHRYQYVLGGVMPIVTFVATLAAMVRGIDILYGMMAISVLMVLTGCFYLADMVYELVKPDRIVMCEN